MQDVFLLEEQILGIDQNRKVLYYIQIRGIFGENVILK